MALLFKERIPTNKEAFASKVIDVSSKLGLRSPDDLMAVMYSESGLDSTIQNTKYPVDGGYATGLIQLIPSSARTVGTTTSALKGMSNVQQLDYVYKYYLPYKGRLNSYVDLYLATFFPVAIGKPDSFVLQAKDISSSSVARSNPIFDLNKDNKITVGEVKQAFLKRLSEIKGGKEAVIAFAKVYKTPIILSFLAVGIGGYLIYKYGQIKIVN